jgi:hypothetical protein
MASSSNCSVPVLALPPPFRTSYLLREGDRSLGAGGCSPPSAPLPLYPSFRSPGLLSQYPSSLATHSPSLQCHWPNKHFTSGTLGRPAGSLFGGVGEWLAWEAALILCRPPSCLLHFEHSFFVYFNGTSELAIVAETCKPSYLGGIDWKDFSLRSAYTSLGDSISTTG